ncbi:TMEM175 family protein [Caulobacter segnis]|uniref:TMEM175 family protein n=1 Tax=Caulobacter segnis TaxID=88688 RepID=UPI0024104A5F|nr:TMEM175 family protein [Caulobacter segnis]MDG2523573.1 TMEM175 family protein [Caulobacter segnis]
MLGTEKTEADAAKRLDAFVDAAFAFALTLLIITGGLPPATMADLALALGRIPAFAASFALIILFWMQHRAFGRITARRDGWATGFSLGIVFVMLIYVFPLRLLAESTLHFVFGKRLPGRGLIASFADLRTLYMVYGLGFGLLAALFAGLFAAALRAPDITETGRVEARLTVRIWTMIAVIGLLSILAAAFVPISAAPWLPGSIYGVIPLAVWLLASRQKPIQPPAGAEA